jgi:hypothetical protein
MPVDQASVELAVESLDILYYRGVGMQIEHSDQKDAFSW